MGAGIKGDSKAYILLELFCSEVAESRTRLSNFTFPFHFHALEKEMETHSSVLSWRIPGTGEPGGLPSMGSHRVRHEWSDLAAAAAAACITYKIESSSFQLWNSRIRGPSLVVSPLTWTCPPQPWCESWKTRVTVDQRGTGVRCGNALARKSLWPGHEKWKLPEGVIHEKTLLWLQRQETRGQRRQNVLRVWNGTWSRAGVGTEGGCPAGRPVPTWRIPTTRAFQGNVAAEPSEHGCFIIPFYPQGNGGPAKQIRNAFRTKFNYTYLFLSFLYFLYLTM